MKDATFIKRFTTFETIFREREDEMILTWNVCTTRSALSHEHLSCFIIF